MSEGTRAVRVFTPSYRSVTLQHNLLLAVARICDDAEADFILSRIQLSTSLPSYISKITALMTTAPAAGSATATPFY